MRAFVKSHGVIVTTIVLSSLCTLFISNTLPLVFSQDDQDIKPLTVLKSPRWQYLSGSVADDSLKARLEELGKQGWELVWARHAASGRPENPQGYFELIFKQPIAE